MNEILKFDMTIDLVDLVTANLDCSCGEHWHHFIDTMTNQPIIFECPACHAMAKFELFKPFITPYTPA